MQKETITLELDAREASAVRNIAAALRVRPEELLWFGLDTTMQTLDYAGTGRIKDDVFAFGIVQGTAARFDRGELSEWAAGGACRHGEGRTTGGRSGPLSVELTGPELNAFGSYARRLRLTPQELLFSAVDCMMAGSEDDDTSVEFAHIQAALDRFKFNCIPEWAAGSENGKATA
jgi:hypothetical protein